MELNEIKTSLDDYLKKLGYHLYSVNYKSKDKILEILIDESIDLDEVTKLSEKISEFMDKFDNEFDEYLLDVASAGCERPIKNDEEIFKAVNSYVHLKTNDFEEDGVIKEFKDGIITLEYLDKTRKKTKNIKVIDVKKLRYAVKFKEN